MREGGSAYRQKDGMDRKKEGKKETRMNRLRGINEGKEYKKTESMKDRKQRRKEELYSDSYQL